MELKVVGLTIPKDANIIVGQSHFIKTVEDIYEAIVNTSPHIKFGLAFNEASGPCLTRSDGNDPELEANAVANATAIGAGHVFCIALRDGFPDQCAASHSGSTRGGEHILRYCEPGGNDCG